MAEGIEPNFCRVMKVIAMSATPRIKRLRFALWAAALALTSMAAGGNGAWAQAAQEEDDLENHVLNADKRLFNSILGIVGLGSSAPEITYRERSPLVVPQGRDLPPPGKLVKSPDWPVDPEVKAARAEAKASKYQKPPRFGHEGDPIAGTPEQYKTGNTGQWGEPIKGPKEPDFLSMLMSGKLYGSWDEVGKFEGEPPRNSLVDPPPGYLTPSPAAPYGVTPLNGVPEKKEKKL
jgi:hypothetical protein